MQTRIAGILNITPDSFHSESRCMTPEEICRAALRICREGADMIDVGACSTRPGSTPVTEDEEMERLGLGLPVIADACPQMPLSIDTFRPAVAARCMDEWNVAVINDVSGGSDEMFRTVASRGRGYILTFPGGTEGDIVEEMMSFFRDRLSRLAEAGVRDVTIDPGFGFGRDLMQNYSILAHLDRLAEFGVPVMAGVSRKSMAYRLLDITPEESLEATIALDTLAMTKGASWLRVHDVKETVQAVRIFEAFSKGNI